MPTVDEYARWRGVSVQRVRELLRTGEIEGHRVGSRQWYVDDAAYQSRRRLGPPMSPRMAWALIAVLSGNEPHPELRVRRDRLTDNLHRILSAGDDAPALLSSWLRHRGERLRFSGDPSDLPDLVGDPRVVASGVSDPRSGLSTVGTAEVWLRDFSQLRDVEGAYLLLPDPRGNVVIHRGGFEQEGERAPLGLVMADLADWNGAREDGRVVALLANLK